MRRTFIILYMLSNPFGLQGLSGQDVIRSRERHGSNRNTYKESNSLIESLKGIVTEPMFLLLLVAASVYFILGETAEGIFMTAAILLVSAISFYQDTRSRNALKALQDLTAPKARVIRNGEIISIHAEDIVISDLVVAGEGELVPADGKIIQSADFSLNESMLTGESFSVFKTATDDAPFAFQGTQVVSGQAVLEVSAIGNQTMLGKISGSLVRIGEEETPLQAQIGNFVKKMAGIGILVFILVWGINYFRSDEPDMLTRLVDSLLKGLTLAMSILPEEIPVAFGTFMALGSRRLMMLGIIVKNTRTVETLGSADVICTDKTGTITENKMELARVSIGTGCRELDGKAMTDDKEAAALLRISMFASEAIPFDPMEVAIHEAYGRLHPQDERPSHRMVHEYPLEGKPPMMTHVFISDDGLRVIAAKGAPEAILACCDLPEEAKDDIRREAIALGEQGFRILAVGEAKHDGDAYPKTQQMLSLEYKGLLAFYDPPKPGIREVFDSFYRAGIDVKIITGDSPVTTAAIARQSGFRSEGGSINGDQLLGMDDATLEQTVATHAIFTRMFPEAKLRIIEALKRQGKIVAMTGDGVNDAPALKSAHIGIAMGKRGTALARSTASLILTDDDLGKMIDAVAMGRRIYSNLKKAIQYIISIHIPIVLTVFLPLVLGWIYPNIFTPVHVIFLELIMGPTCSIIYENEPPEAGSMDQPPRRMSQTFLSWKELSLSFWQGIAITAGTLASYQLAVMQGCNEDQTRTLVFLSMVTANICLTLVNRSFLHSFISTAGNRNWMLRGILALTILLTVLLIAIPSFRSFFDFAWSGWQLTACAVFIGMASVAWFEIYKWRKRRKLRKG